MKTEKPFYSSDLFFARSEAHKKKPTTESPTEIKYDFRNYRFAVIENKSIQDSSNWDSSWFTAYE